jgi:transposase
MCLKSSWRDIGDICRQRCFFRLDSLDRQVRLVGSFAHVRRNFVKVIDTRGKGSKKTGSAEVGLDYIRKLYAIEKAGQQQGLSPPELGAFRKEKAEEILNESKACIDNRVKLTPPKRLLGRALNYALNHWPKLIRYVEDGHITPDNNAAENAIRPFVVGRNYAEFPVMRSSAAQ